ncbi:MAG TPA: TIR domain-containing protein, partial [Burkholderiales bacterium]|nr:TIR domain-containing protein [Burkholderiales bacterium]
MLNVFLSYRREDSAGYTGRLNDRFVERWGEERVFFDLDTIAPGEDFVEAIDRTLAQSEVMILVIGPRWLTATEPDGRRRIDESADYHRIEVERALQRGIRIIPALVGGARMPGEAQLPEALKKLARRNAVEISDKRFKYDADQLGDEVERILEKAQAAAQAQGREDAARLEEARRAEAQENARREADEQRIKNEEAQRIPEEHRRPAEARGLAVLDVLVLIPAPSDAAPFDPDRAWQDLSQAAKPLVA